MLEVEGQRARTSVVEGSLAPVWGDSFAFDIRPDSVLQLRLMDEDSLASDALVGTVVVPLPPLHVGESVQREALFKNGDEGRVVFTVVGLGAAR
jgi:Ca2+-dependent lipid-binding protein